jgi:hypothetical protein
MLKRAYWDAGRKRDLELKTVGCDHTELLKIFE